LLAGEAGAETPKELNYAGWIALDKAKMEPCTLQLNHPGHALAFPPPTISEPNEVWVKEDEWTATWFAFKISYAQDVQCATEAAGFPQSTLIFRGNISGKVLATWDGKKLIPD
jgi:hypothetical protein